MPGGTGVVLTLLHRHDIRVGIASAMYIRSHWCVSRSLRLELLCVLHLCYWRWSTKMLLEEMEHRVEEYARAQPLARAQIWREVWQIMESKMEKVQVVARSDSRELEVVARTDVKRVRDGSGTDTVRAYHAYMNPSSRRSGAKEFSILVGSLEDGSLWRACEDIARKIEGKTSYTAVSDAMREHEVTLWQQGSYNCVRLARWLFQAERVELTWSEEEWRILSTMGDGVRAGMERCGLRSYAQAVRLCELISSASGESYAMDSLVSFLCLGSLTSESSSNSHELQWPDRAKPVTIADDLEMGAEPLITSQPLARDPGMSQGPTQSSFIATPRSFIPFIECLLCMRPIVECLDVNSHFALRQCGRCTCQSFFGGEGVRSPWRVMNNFIIG